MSGQNRCDHDALLAEYLEFMRDSGVRERWGRDSFGWAETAGRDKSTQPGSEVLTAAPGGARSFASLEDVREYLGECTRCRLSEGRKNIVFGVGNPKARLVFIGEGPGADEDIQGEPFVGRAGQLLTDIIEKGMKLKRPDVYIANIVKCRPPGNRDPLEDEIAACSPFLHAQLDVIRPKVICTLGKFAAQTLLQTTERISALRGKVFDYRGIKLVPTFHPAYLLRNPADKKLAWIDIQKVMALLDAD